MAKYVKCKICGTTIEKKSRMYRDGSRYVCTGCALSHNYDVKIRKRQDRLAKTGMKQSYFTMILKIIIGISMILSCNGLTRTKDEFFTALVMGLLLILWGIVPFIRRKKIKARYGSNTN